MKSLFIVWMLFVSVWTHADGVPIDENGNLLREHFTVDLTLDQKMKLEYSRRINLTEEQMHRVRNVWPLDVIDVLDPHHHDCTCGMYYAVWINPDQIAFFGDSSRYEEPDEHVFSEQYRNRKTGDLMSLDYSIFIGVDGEIYHKGSIVLQKDLNALIRKIQSSDNTPYFFVVYVAPKKSNDTWSMIKSTKAYLERKIPKTIDIYWM